jgi:formate dehydrogenase iron-sulfur subunit
MTTLPLMESALLCTIAPARATPRTDPGLAPLIPARPLGEGEQYRFHFDMTKCIGCKCCVVACNEQNGNPAAINWRRVGEVGHWRARYAAPATIAPASAGGRYNLA